MIFTQPINNQFIKKINSNILVAFTQQTFRIGLMGHGQELGLDAIDTYRLAEFLGPPELPEARRVAFLQVSE